MLRPHALSIALVGIVASAEIPAEARAQGGSDAEQAATADWRLADTRKGFCIQLLLDPAKLRDLPDGVRLISAENYKELHPVLRGVVNSQPEYKSWSPSALCFYYLTRVVGASESIGGDKDPTKAPVLGIWTVAGQTGTWQRVSLAPGIELHYVVTDDAWFNTIVERLVAAAVPILDALPEKVVEESE